MMYVWGNFIVPQYNLTSNRSSVITHFTHQSSYHGFKQLGSHKEFLATNLANDYEWGFQMDLLYN